MLLAKNFFPLSRPIETWGHPVCLQTRKERRRERKREREREKERKKERKKKPCMSICEYVTLVGTLKIDFGKHVTSNEITHAHTKARSEKEKNRERGGRRKRKKENKRSVPLTRIIKK